MKPRTFARRPSSIGSNQLSKSRSSASPVQAVVVLLVMAWSPVRRSNAGISRVANPGDYATPNSNHLRDGTADRGECVYVTENRDEVGYEVTRAKRIRRDRDSFYGLRVPGHARIAPGEVQRHHVALSRTRPSL